MASNKRQQAILILLLFSLFTISTSIKSSETTGGVAIYWGQNSYEGDLSVTCDTGHYEIVLLAFLINFGAGRTPKWNFAGHCDNGALKKCTELETEIKHCQANGIKVFLSIGGGEGTDYSLSSPDDAKDVAKYLYDNFLSGQYGPLGSVTLDGIDFDIEKTEDYWENLALELDALRQPKKFYLSAAPQCPTEPKIYYLEKAIKTEVFDYIFIQFYNNPSCSYATGIQSLLDSWNKWISLVPLNNTVFMGLPAAESAARSGYIPPDVLNTQVLPIIKGASNYGGVMLWDRYRDLQYDYSGKILPNVVKSVLQYVTTVSEAIFECVSAALHRILHKSS